MKFRIGRIFASAASAGLLALNLLHAQEPMNPPAWWSDPATAIIDGNAVADNYAPVNLGQLKHVAAMARIHLDRELARIGSSSGQEVAGMVEAFAVGGDANFAPANLGQLKAVAQPFYDRLLSVGYDTRKNLIDRQYPVGWSHDYPWNPDTPLSENYVPANIGQLKMVFSFDLASSAGEDGDGLPDWWELFFLGSSTVYSDSDPAPGDPGIFLRQAYLEGRNPSGKTVGGAVAQEHVELEVFLPL